MTVFVWIYAISAAISLPFMVAAWCDYYSRLRLGEFLIIIGVCLLPALNTALLLFLMLSVLARARWLNVTLWKRM